MELVSDGRRLLLLILCALWVLVFAYAFVGLLRAPLTGGLPDGGNRPMVYLGWQGIAGMLAVAIFGVGRGWPRGSSVRGMTTVPLVIAILLLVALGGLNLWSGAGDL